MMEADGSPYGATVERLAARLGVSASDVAADPASVNPAPARAAVLAESVALSRRFAFAATMVERHDVSPAAVARDPRATGPAITMKEAQQAAMNLEGIPRYDHIFIVILENKATSAITALAVRAADQCSPGRRESVHQLLLHGQPQRAEPARHRERRRLRHHRRQLMALHAGGRRCQPPRGSPAGWPVAVRQRDQSQHQATGRICISAMTAAGMIWRVYSESREPGTRLAVQRRGGPGARRAGSRVSRGESGRCARVSRACGSRSPRSVRDEAQRVHRRFQDVRSSPEFSAEQSHAGRRPMGRRDSAEPVDARAGTSISSAPTCSRGDVGQLNFLEPDQCDDMHGMNVRA